MATGSEKSKRMRDIGYETVDALLGEERRSFRRKVAICLIVLLALVAVSLPILTYITSTVDQDDTFIGYINNIPTTLTLLGYALHDGLSTFLPLGGAFTYGSDALRFSVMLMTERIQTVGVTVLAGVLLGLSGMLFQNVFRNPIASPTMLGIQSGISLGVMVLVAMFGGAAAEMVLQRYVLCYGCGIAVLLLTILGGKFIAGHRPFSVVDMLLVGTALGAIANLFIQYVPQMWDEGTWNLYYSLSEMVKTDTSWVAFASMIAVLVIAVIPIFLLRWRLNALSFENTEVKLLGIDPSHLRIVALICGSLMVLVALVSVGTVGMAALIVPFIVRYAFGSEARQQFWGNVLLGPIVLLICRNLCDLFQMWFPILGASLTIGTVVSVIVLPLFAWIIVTKQRGWE